MSKKRTLDSFFVPAAKRTRDSVALDISTRVDNLATKDVIEKSNHKAYPIPISNLTPLLSKAISLLPEKSGREVNDQPDLDLLYFEPYIARHTARKLFEFLRSELPFYRVEYDIKRFGKETHIRTPRYTTVFGLDETSRFDDQGTVVDAVTTNKVSDKRYDRYPPRPIPACLNELRLSTETATGCRFNFCLVNYYASGADSISYHSDDERFLGQDPAIASFSLGAKRDFYMKHKPPKEGDKPIEAKPLKLALDNGDMILMRGKTQANWLHAIPKRSGKNAEDGGRINITFRRAMVKGGTENYYNYNVGTGPVYRWDAALREMRVGTM